jgi:hypothetical protein
MNFIKFYKNHITTFIFDETAGEWIEKNIEDNFFPINFYFNKLVYFEENLTVFDFIKHLYNNKEIIDAFFSAYNNGVSIEKFYQECLEKQEYSYKQDIKEIEIVWESDYFKDEENNINFINDWVSFFGIISEKSLDINNSLPIRSMNLIKLRNWKNLPLRINRFICYQSIDINKKRKVYTKLSGIKEFTLLDLICGFLKELTWYGEPEQQAEVAKELFKRIEEASEKGEENVVIHISKKNPPLDLSQMEAELKKSIEDEDYIKAKNIKEMIDEEKSKKSNKKT